MSKQKNDRQTNLTRGIRVEIASLVYNLIEVVVSVTVGLLTGSAALVSWGLDSTVEATSAGTLIWRLKGEKDGGDKRTVLHRKKVALFVVACAFWIVVAAILYEAVSAFISQEAPGFNWWGIAILFVSLVVNPLLAWGKYRYGKRLDSPALKYDAKDTLICEYQTVVVLAGIGLTQWMGWWWADPVAALLIVPYVAWEAFEATKDARSVDPDEAEATADA
ncbi:cation diffusion facilitator family transporter [Roseovarius sp. MBR-154]|jgi:cation diffusion facilitator family transporter|uniref:cation diffusion facilitator family transporter n=1 Tax=Roseobacteraceae TaxID=2854170 RepID=UPI00237A1313|nr:MULTISPECIES: cation diffusion facilitator family transporter [Roseobacteraceae]MDD9745778.1 cation diffusion facilitator family transporter [Marinovum sp. PR37]MDE4100191.1 cation diffusion facilitator family transporter [Phaeobacter gallaeciensis]MDE4108992.1 cation diffusion facilitator family transporter [Phaeobacter gallaeciensis]MDE4113437.1 cation diffusion facilitator family transporter [Phaeobacter gallaeciensis]MDE4117895.1 cation diffusion facilitator family transporter [Phaeobac